MDPIINASRGRVHSAPTLVHELDFIHGLHLQYILEYSGIKRKSIETENF